VPLPFQVGVPALEAFPFEIWNRILHRYLKKPSRELLFYGDPGGYMPLRRALASYLTVARAVRCTPEQIIVVSGAQQALDIAARLLLDPGDQAWIEEPGYAGAYWAIVAAGARPVPINVDQDGLNVQQGIARSPRARMIYITPSHQFPLGTTMTLTRRLELLRWAHKSGAWVLEDDYDNEFHYASHPIASLQGLDQSGNVIYLGTFSKIMFASLRLGYMVVAPDLVDGFLRAKAVTDRHCHTIEQAALAEFIIEGHLGRHIRRMRTLYLHRSQVLINAVEKYLGGRVELLRPDAGMHTVAWLPLETDDRKISQLAAADGLQILPLTSFYQKTQQRSGLILGFAGYGDHEIREGIQKLARVLAKVKTQ
jgi:GntR family transcriptional regulator/MocR family aminotransferase